MNKKIKVSCVLLPILVGITMVFAGESPVAREPFSLILIPDTQQYNQEGVLRIGWPKWVDTTDIFYKQTDWIAENKDELNIKMVVHVGDIVQSDYPPEWEVASKAFAPIDAAEIPYVLALGNHDMGFELIDFNEKKWSTAASRETFFNDYFTPERFEKHAWYGGGFPEGRNENHYSFAEAGGMKFLLISLTFMPSDEELDWASGLCDKYPDHRCIVVTHLYIDANGQREKRDLDWYKAGENNGEAIWEKLVSKKPNIFLVLCGHYTGEAVLTTVRESGEEVHQVLADYQGWENGGNGFLKILTFLPDENRIEQKTYSPSLDEYYSSTNNPVLHYDMTLTD